jgi:acyl dehydratase
MTFYSPTFVGEQVIFEIQVTQTYPDSGLIDLKTCAIHPNKEFGLKGRTLVKIAGKSRNLDWQPAPMIQIEDMQGESFKGLQLGQSAELQRIFSRNDLTEYTSISGDANPIFTDPNYARSVGFDDNPLPGGLLGGMFSCLLGTHLPGRGTNWLKQSLQYPTPAYLEEQITARVDIIRLRSEKNLVNLHTYCTNPLGDVVCDGKALVYVEDLEL